MMEYLSFGGMALAILIFFQWCEDEQKRLDYIRFKEFQDKYKED